MHNNTQGEHRESLMDKAKDMMHLGHKDERGPFIDPAVPRDKQNRFGNQPYGTQGGASNNPPGYDTVASHDNQARFGDGTYGTTSDFGSNVPGAGDFSTEAEYNSTRAGQPDKAAILDAYGANVTRADHDPSIPIDPVRDHPAVIGVDAAEGHGAAVIPSTYNVDDTAHNTGPVVGTIDRAEAGVNDEPLRTATATHSHDVYGHNTTANTSVSAGTGHEKKGFMANIKEKVHGITDKLHRK